MQKQTATFPDRLRAERKFQHISQKKLAEQLQTDQRTISAYEVGSHEPKVFMLCCLADALHVSTDYLLGRTDRRN